MRTQIHPISAWLECGKQRAEDSLGLCVLLAREAGVGRGSPGGRASLGAAHGLGLGLGHGIRGQFST